ncbi:MAG: hypothetical protein WB611_22240 [Stellaceae bacterium]
MTFDNHEKVYKPAKIVPQAAIEITRRETEARDIYNRVSTAVNTELAREDIRHLTARDIIERFLDSGGLAFIGGTAISQYDNNDDVIANRIIAKIIKGSPDDLFKTAR